MLVIFSLSVLSCIHIVVFLKEADRHHEAISHTNYWSAMFWWVCLLTLWLLLFLGFSFNSFVILNSIVEEISCWREEFIFCLCMEIIVCNHFWVISALLMTWFQSDCHQRSHFLCNISYKKVNYDGEKIQQ